MMLAVELFYSVRVQTGLLVSHESRLLLRLSGVLMLEQDGTPVFSRRYPGLGTGRDTTW